MKLLRGMAVTAAAMIFGLTGCGSDAESAADAESTVTVTVTATPTLDEPSDTSMEGEGEAGTGTEGFGTIQELGETVCDSGTFKDTGDDYDFPCEVDGHRVLLTDWSTFGGAPEEGPGKLTVNDVFGIQGPPAAVDEVRERLDR